MTDTESNREDGSMPDLTKTRTVLQRNNAWPEGGGKAVFTPEDEDHDEGRSYRVILDDDVYVDMGRPDTITVTIELGDLLNESDTKQLRTERSEARAALIASAAAALEVLESRDSLVDGPFIPGVDDEPRE